MPITRFEIDGKQIGDNAKAFIVAEVAQSHDGSLGTAYAFIDAAAESGADAIKFQTHIASAESTLDDNFRINFSKQDASRFDYWKRMEFSKEQWQELANYSREKGLIFLSSAFSMEAMNLLEEIGMSAWKVASGEIASNEILDKIIQSKKPVLISTGMSAYKEIDQIVNIFEENSSPYVLMQCTSKYPTSLKEVGLNVLQTFSEKYHCCTGLSDHSGSIHPGIAAISDGASVVELHVTFDKRMFGPDVIASVSFGELKRMADYRDSFYEMKMNPVNKDGMASDLNRMRDLFLKSLAPIEDLKTGTVLTRDILTTKKPGTGIPMSEIDKVLGKTLRNDVPHNKLLSWDDIDD